ncbi:hypothetical protein ABIB99_008968 [Bradyrhizobium sp. LA6.1]
MSQLGHETRGRDVLRPASLTRHNVSYRAIANVCSGVSRVNLRLANHFLFALHSGYVAAPQ